MIENKKVLYINGRFLTQKITGVQRFALSQIEKLAKSYHVIVLCPRNVEHCNVMCLPSSVVIRKVGILTGHAWEQLSLPAFLYKIGSPEIISLSGLSPILYRKAIFTIHDMSFKFNRKWFSLSYYLWYSIAYSILIRTSLKIITVSKFSKSEILKYYNVRNEKIKIVYNVIPMYKENNALTSKVLRKQKYILVVSSLEPRKNLGILFDAFSMLGIEDVELFVVGAKNRVFSSKGTDYSTYGKVKFLGYVDDIELERLYTGAEFFVYPSLYEGFGLPPTEAISHGTRVLCSNIESIREVCGNVPIYFDPNSRTDLIEKIRMMLEDTDNVELYTSCAKNHLNILKKEEGRFSISNAIKD